ncbi:MAG: TlpA family protein disulfide reductase [Phycisphaerales bacterium JB043]
MRRYVLGGMLVGLMLAGAPQAVRAQGQIQITDNREKPQNPDENIIEDPREILQNSIDALELVDRVRYNANLEARSGQLPMPRIDGNVILQRDTDSLLKMLFRTEARITTPDDPEGITYALAFDGTTIYALDHPTSQLIWGDLMTGGTDLLSGTTELIRDVFVNPEPYASELKAQDLSMQGIARDVYGKQCYVVVAEFSPEFTHRWFIEVEDFLPRRMDRIQSTPQGELTVKYFIRDLEVNPEISADAFVLSAPDGYETTMYDTSGLIPVGEPAPDFTLKDQDGNDVSLSDYRGQIVLLDFWATWCSACKVSMPGVQKLSEKYDGKGVKIIGVQTLDQGKEDEGRAYFHEQGYTYTDVFDPDDTVAMQYRLTGLPSFYVIDRDGTVLYRFPGGPDEEMLEKLLGKYLSDAD